VTAIYRAPLFVLLLACACSRSEVAVYDAPKEQAPLMAASAAEAPESPRPGGLPIAWSVPAGWTERAGSDMRVATLIPPSGKGQAELSIVQLSGDAGGALANVNRWRGQLGLEPVSSLAGQTATVGTPAGKTLVVDLTGGEGQAMLAAILKDGDARWFFKLAGPVPAVAGLKADFHAFLGSLRHGGS